MIVDQGFVDQVLRGRNPVGQRVRFAGDGEPEGGSTEEQRPWYEIVGVVKDLGMQSPMQSGRAAGLYLPAAPGSAGPVQLVVHAQGDLALGMLALSGALPLGGDGALTGEGAMSVDGLSAGRVALLAAYAAFMMGVCLLACVVPTRRALGVEAIEALRVE